MAGINPAVNFIVSDVDEVSEDALRQIVLTLSTSLEASEFSFRKMTDRQEVLLTMNGSHIEESDFENLISMHFELEGHLVTVTQVKLDSVFAMKFSSKRDIDELLLELQIKDVFKDQTGNTKDIKAVIGNKTLSVALVILDSCIGDDVLHSDLSAVEDLLEVYRVNSAEFLDIFFGKCGTLENHLEKVWSCDDSGGIHKVVEITNDRCLNGHRKLSAETNLNSDKDVKVLEKEKVKTIAIEGEYASEKCELLERLCQKLTVGDCSLTVNYDSKVVTITGKDIRKFQECVAMIEMQMKLFHCEEITNMSKKLFNLIRNKKVKKCFLDILAENQLDNVILFEDSLNRPAVLGLNKVKTRNFIEWLGKFFAKESIKFYHSHNKLGCKILETFLEKLELNRWVSVDVIDDEVVVQGLVTDVLSILEDVKNCLLSFKHILVEKDSLNYINEYGIEGIACQALLEENHVCLFTTNKDDELLIKRNPMRRKTFYAPPVLYNVLKDSLQDLKTTIKKSCMTEIHYNYSSIEQLSNFKGRVFLMIRNKYQISSFCGKFDWPKTVAALAERDLIYELDPGEATVTIFSEKSIVLEVKSILQGCLRATNASEPDYNEENYCLQNHDFNIRLAFQSENHCGEFSIPLMTYHIRQPTTPPNKCMVS